MPGAHFDQFYRERLEGKMDPWGFEPQSAGPKPAALSKLSYGSAHI